MTQATATRPAAAASPVLARIAQQHLQLDSLEEQGRDALDFKDLHVAGIRAALEAAYLAGQQSRTCKPATAAQQATQPAAQPGTAQAAYQATSARIQAAMGQLQVVLDGHAARAAAEPGNWGFSGDLGRVEAALVLATSIISQ